MRYRIHAAMALLLAASLGAAACSGGDDDSASNTTNTTRASGEQSTSDSGGHDRADYEAVLSDSASQGLGVSEDDAGCFAGALIDVVGVDGLEAAGAYDKIKANPEGDLSDYGIALDEQQGADLVEGLSGCTDLRALLESEMSSGEGIPAEGAKCLVDNLDDDTFTQLMSTALTQGDSGLNADPDLEAALEQAATTCIAQGVDMGA